MKLWSFLFCCFLVFINCGKSKKSSPIPSDQVRKGISIKSVSSKYYDGAPSISSKGDRIVFLSGRDLSTSETSSVLLKDSMSVFKYDLSSSTDPVLVFSSTEQVGFVEKSSISPNGEWILIVTNTGGKSKIFVQKFSSENVIRKELDMPVKSDGVFVSNAIFSPGDAPLIALEVRSERGQNSIYVVDF